MASFFRPPRFLIRERPAPRPQSTAPVEVTCYRCSKKSTHSPFAQTTSCPHCAGRLCIGDVHIESGHWGSSIQTTGSVTIDEGAQVTANLIICSGDLHLSGKIHAMCICGGQATITSTADIQGGVRTSRLVLVPGATIRGCLIETQSKAIGSIDVESAMRTAPGKGQAAQIEIKPMSSTIAHTPDIAARIYPSADGPRQARMRVVS
ncbi:MAG: polymer-forming cytoskeletal protein [Phycisphaerales bacterium]